MQQIAPYLSFLEKKGIVAKENIPYLKQVFFTPLEEFCSRPKKKIRQDMVSLSFSLASPKALEKSDLINKCSDILEMIHAGSLIVDDIQDNSLWRRGSPTLHLTHGLPLALNMGNGLYFFALSELSLLPLPTPVIHQMQLVCHTFLSYAHLGQALDLGVSIDTIKKNQVKSLAMNSLKLKSGTLMSLAFSLGALLGEASPSVYEALKEFGSELGVALQMWDDISNLSSWVHQSSGKQFEDLLLKRLSWIWVVAADLFSQKIYDDFLKAVLLLPEKESLVSFLKEHPLVEEAKKKATDYLKNKIECLVTALNPLDEKKRESLYSLIERLILSYE